MLEHALHYAARGWPVFRLTGFKTPFKGSHGHLDATTDPVVVERLWTEAPQANIGLACGELVVVDLDGPTAIAAWGNAVAAAGGIERTLTAQTSRGLHLYFKSPAGVRIRTRNAPRARKGADGIDVKGHGGYVVLPPSINRRTGFRYRWLVEAPIAELPVFLINYLQSFETTKVTANGQDLPELGPRPGYLNGKTRQKQSITRNASSGLGTEWSAAEEQRVREALGAIPARGYDQWVQVGMALHSLTWDRPDGTSAGFDLFDDWSGTEPELYSLDATEKKWASFGKSGRSGVGVGTLFHLAEQHGWTGLVPQGDAKEKPPAGGQGFGFINADDMALLECVSGDKRHGDLPRLVHNNGHTVVFPTELSSPSNESPLIQLNQDYACIGDVGGKCLVMGWVPSKVDPLNEIPSFQSFKSFAERFGHQYVTVAKETKDGGREEESKQLGAYWLKWRRRRSFDGIDLEPAGAALLPNNTLNLWRGFAVAATAGGWSLLQRHILEVLADGNADAAAYILRWSAWAVQHPGERAEAALVFRGSKGTGKGTFAHALRRLFGAHGLHIANSKHLVGSFNAHLRNCLLLYADEAFWAGDKQGESTLKALITEPTLTIEQKGVDAVQWRNRIHLVMTANADWVVPASREERRYAVFNVAEKRMGDQGYFEALYREINSGGLAAMLHDLQRAELGSWHPRQIVHTEALTDQKKHSMAPLHEWWEAMLQDGVIPAATKDTPDTAMAVYLLNVARDFAPRLKELNATRLGLFLKAQGCWKLHKSGGNAWRFPPLPEARDRWQRAFRGWQWEIEAREWATRN